MTGIAAARHAFDYRGSAGAMVRGLKFEHDSCAGNCLLRAMLTPMLEALAHRQKQQPIRSSILVSVPLHPSKLRRRGMDQAA
ncbi:MAG: hypothetical protein ACYTG5_17800, partial [Planctomycetota bacterium]